MLTIVVCILEMKAVTGEKIEEFYRRISVFNIDLINICSAVKKFFKILLHIALTLSKSISSE